MITTKSGRRRRRSTCSKRSPARGLAGENGFWLFGGQPTDSRRLGGGWVGRVVRSGGAFTVTSVVGNSNPEWNGDHLTASSMQLGSVAGLHLLGDVLFVADGDSHRVVAVNVGSAAVSVAGLSIGVGEARMVAGGGQGFGGFNGSAVPPQVALLNQPSSVATTPDGGLYLVDRGNGRIRRFER